MCFLRERINLAIALVKTCARSIAAMPAIIFWPIVQAAGTIAFICIWVFYAVCLATVTTVVDDPKKICNADEELCTQTKMLSYDKTAEYSGWFMLFSFFWSTQFIVAIGQICVSMAIAKYYFARDKTEIGNTTLTSSIKSSMYYHLGTAAFGSLLIAIIKMIRAIVKYIEVQQKRLAKGNEHIQKVAAAIFCCIKCCLWCIEKFMKFLNKNAYVQTAIYGTSFMTSAKKAFFLILRNVARVAAVGFVSDFILIIGQMFISMLAGAACYVWVTNDDEVIVSSPWTPTIFTMMIAYAISQLFTEVFGMGMTTLIQCFIADEEMGGGFAEDELKEFIDSNASKEESNKAKKE